MTMGKLLRLFIGLLVLMVVAAGAVAIQVNIWLKPVPAMAVDPVMVAIPSGSSLIGIANILEANGLVRNATVFRYYAKFRKMDQRLQAGNYLLQYGLTMDDILKELNDGNVYRPTVSVTIPEGYEVEQIANKLAASGLVNAEEFMELINQTVPTLGKVKDGQHFAMEGYLFPDTYEFDVNITPEQILARMQRRLEEVLTAEMRDRALELGMDIHDVITLASLVEREAQVESEFSTIAAVMHNRLKKQMALQLCASVIYALGEHRTELSLKDLEVESPYNTYKYAGLPPGPIASPGKAAIMAALYPADTDYLYYVVKGDGSGEHLFGRTLAEHNANIRKSQENEKR